MQRTAVMKDWIRTDFEGLNSKRASITQSLGNSSTILKGGALASNTQYLDKIKPKNDTDFY